MKTVCSLHWCCVGGCSWIFFFIRNPWYPLYFLLKQIWTPDQTKWKYSVYPVRPYSTQVKDTLPDSLNFLERCLVLDRDVFFPDIYTFVDIDISSPTTPQMNSSPEKLVTSHHLSNRVSKEEFLWQLNFDLGCFCFHQQQYGKAADMFQRVQELMPTVSSTPFWEVASVTYFNYVLGSKWDLTNCYQYSTVIINPGPSLECIWES